MQDTDETKALVKQFSDRSRKSRRVGSKFIVPHKFTSEGDVLDESNFNPKRDISCLSLDDFRVLGALQEKRWYLEEACKDIGQEFEWARKRLKKLSYFEFEDKKSQITFPRRF